MSSLLRLSVDESELEALADVVARVVLQGQCIALRGDLGAGKTTFARALIRALLGDPAHDVPSPTFALRQDYAGPRGPVVHFDLYRLGDSRDLDELGFDEVLASAVTLVEWPERAESALPDDSLHIAFYETSAQDRRSLVIAGRGKAAQAVDAITERWRARGL